MVRADKFLVEKGLFESRNRASEAIRGGRVTIDGALAKPSTRCSDSSKIEIDGRIGSTLAVRQRS